MSPLNITQPLGIWSINVYNGYYKVMSNIPKMGHLPTPVVGRPRWFFFVIALWLIPKVGRDLHVLGKWHGRRLSDWAGVSGWLVSVESDCSWNGSSGSKRNLWSLPFLGYSFRGQSIWKYRSFMISFGCPALTQNHNAYSLTVDACSHQHSQRVCPLTGHRTAIFGTKEPHRMLRAILLGFVWSCRTKRQKDTLRLEKRRPGIESHLFGVL